jgi:hypothetical protein
MRTLLLSIAATIFILANLSAQEVESNRSSIFLDGTDVDFFFDWRKMSRTRTKRIYKTKEAHWKGVSFMFTGLKGLPKDVHLDQGHTYTISINLGNTTARLSDHWVAATGLGFDWSRYHLNGNVSLRDHDGNASFDYDAEDRRYKDSKFLLYYLKVPLLLECQLGEKHNIYIHGGIEGMLKLYSKSQIEPLVGERSHKVDQGGFNMFPVTMRFIAGFGYKGVGLMGYYHPIALFASGKGPEIYPFGVGLILSDN